MTWWHFHPECLAVTPLLFAWWFALHRRWGWYALCVVLVAATKEDAALAVIALGFVVAIRHSWRAGLLTAAGALSWLVVCLKLIIPHATGAVNPFYADQFADLGKNTNQILYNGVRHPSRVLRLAFRHNRHDYYVKMFVPVAGVALLAPVVLLIALPTMLVNVINNQGYPHNYQYQYQALVSAGVFLAVVEAIGRTARIGLRRFQIGLVCACALASNVVWSPSPLNARVYHGGIWAMHTTPHVRAMDEAVHRGPAGAGVSASYPVVPHLTHRTQIYEWPNPWKRANYGVDATKPPEDPKKVQYLVLDTGINIEDRPLFDRLTGPGGSFRVIFERDGAVLAKRLP
jgi:uncharacterized membrane protein